MLRIGSKEKEYSVHRQYIPKSPKWKIPSELSSAKRVIELKDVDEDTGHTIVHYLYTGLYQTLNDPSLPKDADVEYMRSVLAYSAAKLFDLDGLAAQAMKEIENSDKHMSVFSTLAACRHAYQHHPIEDGWLFQYLRRKLGVALEYDETLFVQERYLDELGGNTVFTRVLFTIVGELYVEKARKLHLTPDLASEASCDI